MTDDSKEWPGFAEELGRKTAEVLAKWTAAYDAGRITIKEYYLVIVSLYDSTSGLMPREVSDLLANIEKELRDEAARRKAAKAGV